MYTGEGGDTYGGDSTTGGAGGGGHFFPKLGIDGNGGNDSFGAGG